MPVHLRVPGAAFLLPLRSRAVRLTRAASRLRRAGRGALTGALAAVALAASASIAHAQDTSAPPSAKAAAGESEPSLASLWSTRPGWDAPQPWRTDKWYVQFAYYTWHFHPDPRHEQSYAVDTTYRLDEYWLGGRWLVGLALFQNSFGQFSQYLYGALQWHPWQEQPPFYVKVSAGLLHGYRGEFRDKIPFNHYEIAPAIVPSVGYCWTRYCTEFVLLGGNGALFTVGMTVP
ncbi:MAG: hypothetical protein IT516_04685 [Burkholderiales bacterium]|nr:hypothetical protein [Burkholderiales bacterium]